MDIELKGNVEILYCPTCGITFGINKPFVDRRRADGKSFYCPVGHPQEFRPNTVDKLRKENEALERKVQSLTTEVKTGWRQEGIAKRRAAAARGQATRAKRRVADGRCPCCGKTVDDLRAHMQARHPEYTE